MARPPRAPSIAPLFVGLILLLSCLAPPAGATIVKSFSLRGLAVAAHSVVRGEVVDEEVVYEEIRITVLHEIGHHFGLDEDDLAALGYE